eukprot:366536-Chlamydomonas_euryale.AAC.11
MLVLQCSPKTVMRSDAVLRLQPGRKRATGRAGTPRLGKLAAGWHAMGLSGCILAAGDLHAGFFTSWMLPPALLRALSDRGGNSTSYA